MVHISELTWLKGLAPKDVVSVGDTLEVFVKELDREAKRISLGYKTDATNPWTLFTNKYNVEDVATVTIVSTTKFGAFATIIPCVDGLIHISQIADKKLAHPGEVLTVGQVVDAKIIKIDPEKHEVSLSIRALLTPAEEAEVAE
jgi:4-hydroxy-3-methylbut-2-enyl diphosphate reductase